MVELANQQFGLTLKSSALVRKLWRVMLNQGRNRTITRDAFATSIYGHVERMGRKRTKEQVRQDKAWDRFKKDLVKQGWAEVRRGERGDRTDVELTMSFRDLKELARMLLSPQEIAGLG